MGLGLLCFHPSEMVRIGFGDGSEMGRYGTVTLLPLPGVLNAHHIHPGRALGWELLALQAGVSTMGWDNVGPSGPIVNIQNLN